MVVMVLEQGVGNAEAGYGKTGAETEVGNEGGGG